MQPKDNKTYNQYSKVLEICSCKRIYLWKAQCVVKFTSLNTYVLYIIMNHYQDDASPFDSGRFSHSSWWSLCCLNDSSSTTTSIERFIRSNTTMGKARLIISAYDDKLHSPSPKL